MVNQHKLVAIVFTDIVGFTSLTAKNELLAIELLQKQRILLKPIVEKYRGLWLKEIGDGLLLTFNSIIHKRGCILRHFYSLLTKSPDNPSQPNTH